MMALYAALLAQAWNIAGRLWRAVLVRPRAVLRCGGLCHRPSCRLSDWAGTPGWRLPVLGPGWRGSRAGGGHSSACCLFALRSEGLLLCPGDAGLCRGVPHPGSCRCELHRRWRGPDAAAAARSASNLQFGSARGYFIALVLGFVVAALLVTAWLRHSRFGARLAGGARQRRRRPCHRRRPLPREARLPSRCRAPSWARHRGLLRAGVPVHRPRPSPSASHTSAWRLLVGAIVGGMGTLWGPVLVRAGAARCWPTSRATWFGQLPGLNAGDLRHGAGA